jgi:CxxC motif-containing protein (DUF1111 family)
MSNLRRRKGSLVACMILTLFVGVPLVYAGVFDNDTNGFESQAAFNADRAVFEQLDDIAEGLGPVYNAPGCAECHANTVSAGSSQVNELRVGRFIDGNFIAGRLVSDRAIDPAIQDKPGNNDGVMAFRTSLNLLGDGYVEAIPDSEFTRIRNAQPAAMKGTIIQVPVLEATNGTTRIGRFGWKNQHASLLSFSADAYRNEVGITNPLFPTEKTSNGNSVAAFDTVPDPEEAATTAHPFGPDVEAFTRFMRSTKVPAPAPDPTDAQALADIEAGRNLFGQIGCDNCHTKTITTAPEGTSFNGGTFVVPAALASKNIHPYGDFMLHDVGTGDGIVQNGGLATRNMIRTAPLWGLRLRNRLMHDGLSITPRDAILRHAGEATSVITSFSNLTLAERQQIFAFLDTL